MSNSISVGWSPGVVCRPWRFNALLRFVEGENWTLDRIKGTHRIFKRRGHPTISILVEHRLVPATYVRQVIAVIQKCRSGRCPWCSGPSAGANAQVTASGPRTGNGGCGSVNPRVAGEAHRFASSTR